jgi:hypothetical protein
MSNDGDYYYERAEAELKMAQQSDVPQAVKAHYVIANYYLDHVYTDSDREQSELARLLSRSGN